MLKVSGSVLTLGEYVLFENQKLSTVLCAVRLLPLIDPVLNTAKLATASSGCHGDFCKPVTTEFSRMHEGATSVDTDCTA